MANPLPSFRYLDMICVLRDYTTMGATSSLLIEVKLPDDADAERYAAEVERIPKDFLFKYLMANHFYVVVESVDPNLVIPRSGGYFLYLTVECMEPGPYLRYLYENHHIFLGRADNADTDCLISGNYTTNIKTFAIEGAEVYAFYNIAYRVHIDPANSTGNKLSTFGISIRTVCLNTDELCKFKPNFDVRDHIALFNDIKKVIDESTASYVRLNDLNYKDDKDPVSGYRHFRYRFMCLAADEQSRANDRFGFTLYVTATLDQYANYRIGAYSQRGLMLQVMHPASRDLSSWQSYDMAEMMSDKNLDWPALTYPLETLHSMLFMENECQFVPKLMDYGIRAIDSMGWMEVIYQPYYIDYETGFYEWGEYAYTDKMNPNCVLYKDEFVQCAFPFTGVNPHDGVILYGRIRSTAAEGSGVLLKQLVTPDNLMCIQLTGSTNTWVYFEVALRRERDAAYDTRNMKGNKLAEIFNVILPTLGIDDEIDDIPDLSKQSGVINVYANLIERMLTADNFNRCIVALCSIFDGPVNQADVIWNWMQTVGLYNPNHPHHSHLMLALYHRYPKNYKEILRVHYPHAYEKEYPKDMTHSVTPEKYKRLIDDIEASRDALKKEEKEETSSKKPSIWKRFFH